MQSVSCARMRCGPNSSRKKRRRESGMQTAARLGSSRCVSCSARVVDCKKHGAGRENDYTEKGVDKSKEEGKRDV